MSESVCARLRAKKKETERKNRPTYRRIHLFCPLPCLSMCVCAVMRLDFVCTVPFWRRERVFIFRVNIKERCMALVVPDPFWRNKRFQDYNTREEESLQIYAVSSCRALLIVVSMQKRPCLLGALGRF